MPAWLCFRVLTDNGVGYRSRLFAAALADTGVRHQRTRPYRPQTNGKVERFNRTLLEEWAYRRLYRSNGARDRALPPWVHRYNMHRAHTALGGRPPISRINNLPGYTPSAAAMCRRYAARATRMEESGLPWG
jgi:transposase InsO family protein